MATSYSDNLKIALQGTGDNPGTWGTVTNGNLGTVIEEALVGKANIIFPTDDNYTPPAMTNGPATSPVRCFYLNVTSTGNLSAIRTLTLPSIQKTYIIKNATSGSPSGYSITVSSGAGTTVTVPNGSTMLVYVNGTTGVSQQFSELASGTTIGGGTIVSTTGTQTLTNKTLTAPTVTNGTFSTPSIPVILSASYRSSTATSISTSYPSNPTTLTILDVGVNGAAVGDRIIVSGVTTAIGGIPAADLNKTFTVASIVSTSSVTVTSSVSATSAASGGVAAGLVYYYGSTIPSASTTLVGTTDTATLSNKQITPRIITNGTTYSGTITPTSETADQFNISGLTGATTIAIPSGTPVDGQKLIIRIKDAGVRRTATVPSSTGTYRTFTVTSGTAIATTNGSASIVITDAANGAVVGNSVTIASATAVGGISAVNLNQTFVITAVTTNTITVTAGASATSTTTGGGTPTLTYTRAGMSVTISLSTVTITDVANGATVGDYVTIAGVGASIGGIPAANINGRSVITAKTTDTISIDAGTNATFSATGGGGATLSYDGLKLTWITTAGGYRVIGVTLPTATTAGKTLYVGCIYNSTATAYWDAVAVSTQT